MRTLTVFGGVRPNPQIQGLRNGVDIVIACPGRLADHVQSGHCDLCSIEITVLDEADHMADMGFLPGVRRLMDMTPRDGQRLLFSATLDAGVDVIVKRFLTNPVTHSADSAQSPVSTMAHHVLHVKPDVRLPVLVDLTAAPGRTVVFTRTKHGAKKLTKQLNASGVPAVELHGNLSQNARDRNMAAFSDGTAQTLVATDIAARGIHVDDVSLVIHADPPIEHKAYLHRSGRTARAGATGTVITLMTDEQVRDVRDLTRKAGISPTTTRLDADHPLLRELAPGERTFSDPVVMAAPVQERPQSGRGSGRGGPRTGANGGGSGRSGGLGRSGGGRGGAGGGRQGAGREAAAGGSGQQRSGGPKRSGTARSGGGTGSTTVYSSSTSGGAAAFSAGSRAGSGRGGR